MHRKIWTEIKAAETKAEAALYYRVSHGIGPTLFFAILSVSTLPKYKNMASVKKFRKESDVTFQAAIYPGSQVLLGVLIGLILIF